MQYFVIFFVFVFMWASRDKCVLADVCESMGYANAQWSDSLATSCQNTCDNPTLSHVCRPAGPKAGCICDEGYLKNSSGHCEAAEKCVSCPKLGFQHAVWSDTLATPCQNTCDEPNLRQMCASLLAQAGCICVNGYLKDSSGHCVPAESCVSCSKLGFENAVWSNTLATACQDTCEDPTRSQSCVTFAAQAGCICQRGYLKNSSNHCVLPKSCGCDGDVNAMSYECAWCKQSCNDLDEPRVCAAGCRPGGCGCKPNYVLNGQGKCVRPKQCPAKECGQNERWACQKLCSRIRCREFGRRRDICPKEPQEEIDSCIPKCICKPDYYRDNHGICVTENNCPGGHLTNI